MMYRSNVFSRCRGQCAILLALGWLALLTALNLVMDGPIRNILVYALPVAWVAWRRLKAGFAVAAASALCAVIGGAIPSHPELHEPLYAEGLFAYLKLSAVALGIHLAAAESRHKGTRRPSQH